MMNAELSVESEERIIIPTIYRTNYLAALEALSQNGLSTPVVRTLDFAQRWTAAVTWSHVEETRQLLESCHVFLDPDDAKGRGLRLRLP